MFRPERSDVTLCELVLSVSQSVLSTPRRQLLSHKTTAITTLPQAIVIRRQLRGNRLLCPEPRAHAETKQISHNVDLIMLTVR